VVLAGVLGRARAGFEGGDVAGLDEMMVEAGFASPRDAPFLGVGGARRGTLGNLS
jgi:hypothetical protein